MYHRPAESVAEPSPALLPPVTQPKGWEFIAKTWSGRIIALNILVFILEVIFSPQVSLNSIPYQTLIQFGAKEPVLLAQGEWWRLVTPIVLHGNLIHLLFNNWALFAVAFQLESLLGARRFLALYLLAGIGGNILSSLWSLNLSVGASGSLFGLLGCAWLFERTIQKKLKERPEYQPKAGAYTVMVVANILFGFIIPQIDNAAHIGGLAVGIIFAYILLRTMPNRLVEQQQSRARLVGSIALTLFLGFAVLGSLPNYVKWRLGIAIEKSDRLEERYFFLGRLIQLDAPDNSNIWHHFRLALYLKDFTSAQLDFKLLASDPAFNQRIAEIEMDLESQKDAVAIQWLRAAAGKSVN